MDLLQVIIPHYKYFHILINNEKVSIHGYFKINIDFSTRIAFKDGEHISLTYPVITYYVKMHSDEKKKLYPLFDDCFDNFGVVKTKKSEIIVGEDQYKFPAFITMIPGTSMFRHQDNNVDLSGKVKIELKLEHTDINLFEDIKVIEESVKLERWDILDL